MDLAARGSATQRNDIVMRLGAILLTVGLLFGLVFQPPKAKAVAAVDDLYIIVSAYLSSCGLTWGVNGATSDEFTNTVAGLLEDYLNTEFAGQTPLEWAGDFTAYATPEGKLRVPKLFAEKLSSFASWAVDSLGLSVGSSAVVRSGSMGLLLSSNSVFGIQSVSSSTELNKESLSAKGSFAVGDDLIFSNGAKFEWSGTQLRFYRVGDTSPYKTVSGASQMIGDILCYPHFLLYYNIGKGGLYVHKVFFDESGVYRGETGGVITNLPLSLFTESAVSVGEVSLGATAIDIPNTGTMEDDSYIDIGIGAAAGIGLAALLQQILDAILANDLSATKEIAVAEEVPGTVTDVEELGLPALGAALTTRFPFSIPWDVVKGIKLVAAPPAAPYWKVDFMAPIADRVGGWKGSTVIEIDMGEFPLIGQVCRWASTIGFCLMLAAGTKRLIWTA